MTRESQSVHPISHPISHSTKCGFKVRRSSEDFGPSRVARSWGEQGDIHHGLRRHVQARYGRAGAALHCAVSWPCARPATCCRRSPSVSARCVPSRPTPRAGGRPGIACPRRCSSGLAIASLARSSRGAVSQDRRCPACNWPAGNSASANGPIDPEDSRNDCPPCVPRAGSARPVATACPACAKMKRRSRLWDAPTSAAVNSPAATR